MTRNYIQEIDMQRRAGLAAEIGIDQGDDFTESLDRHQQDLGTVRSADFLVEVIFENRIVALTVKVATIANNVLENRWLTKRYLE